MRAPERDENQSRVELSRHAGSAIGTRCGQYARAFAELWISWCQSESNDCVQTSSPQQAATRSGKDTAQTTPRFLLLVFVRIPLYYGCAPT
jgi:hypothetical protein